MDTDQKLGQTDSSALSGGGSQKWVGTLRPSWPGEAGSMGGGELAPDGRRREAAAKPSAPAYRIIDTKTIRPNVSGDYSSAKKKFECTQNLEFLIEFFGPPSSSQSGVPPRRLIISSRPLRSPKCSLLPSPREHMGGRAHEVNSVCRWRPFRKWSQRSLGANCRVW